MRNDIFYGHNNLQNLTIILIFHNVFFFLQNTKSSKVTMDAVNKAKFRFKRYPELLLNCHVEGLNYASCIIQHEKDLKRNSCNSQFVKFRQCLVFNASKLK